MSKKLVQIRDAFRTQEALTEHSPPRIIFDVGANVGQTARKYRAMFPEAVIHCFEPFPPSFNELREFAKNCEGEIYASPFAVADKNGYQLLYSNEFAPTNSLLASELIGDNRIDQLTKPKETLKVETCSLDEFTHQHNIENIDILKFDIQGGELSALKGAQDLLRNKRIRLIYTEILFIKVYKNQPLFHQLAIYLEGFGYSLFGMYNLHHLENDQLAWGDAIFVC